MTATLRNTNTNAVECNCRICGSRAEENIQVVYHEWYFFFKKKLLEPYVNTVFGLHPPAMPPLFNTQEFDHDAHPMAAREAHD